MPATPPVARHEGHRIRLMACSNQPPDLSGLLKSQMEGKKKSQFRRMQILKTQSIQGATQDGLSSMVERKPDRSSFPTYLPPLYQPCQHLTDGRKARGKRSDLAGILVVLVWTNGAGMSWVLAVSEWAKDQN